MANSFHSSTSDVETIHLNPSQAAWDALLKGAIQYKNALDQAWRKFPDGAKDMDGRIKAIKHAEKRPAFHGKRSETHTIFYHDTDGKYIVHFKP